MVLQGNQNADVGANALWPSPLDPICGCQALRQMEPMQDTKGEH